VLVTLLLVLLLLRRRQRLKSTRASRVSIDPTFVETSEANAISTPFISTASPSSPHSPASSHPDGGGKGAFLISPSSGPVPLLPSPGVPSSDTNRGVGSDSSVSQGASASGRVAEEIRNLRDRLAYLENRVDESGQAEAPPQYEA
jgi:hypothetical protein